VGAPVTIAAITRPGLTAIGLAVAMLWTCLILERATVRRAALEQVRVLHEVDELRQQRYARPVSSPVPGFSRRHRPAAG
jgi:hypothetical protein